MTIPIVNVNANFDGSFFGTSDLYYDCGDLDTFDVRFIY
jgi:hypothetical protein